MRPRLCARDAARFISLSFGVDTLGVARLRLAPVTMQFCAMRLEPGLSLFRPRTKAFRQGPELFRMVVMAQMRGFMRREIIQYEGRRHDQPPGKIQRSFC